MKNPAISQQLRRFTIPRGFTLVELLVVIVIVAVLASLATTMGISALNKAKRQSATVVATAVKKAVEDFYNEYGTYPVATADPTHETTGIDLNSSQGVAMLNALVGKETGATVMNRKGLKFLDLPEGKGTAAKGREGVIYNGTTGAVEKLYDSWGRPYKVFLDADYDEEINSQSLPGTKKKLVNTKVAVWSDGNEQGKPSDDAKTWN